MPKRRRCSLFALTVALAVFVLPAVAMETIETFHYTVRTELGYGWPGTQESLTPASRLSIVVTRTMGYERTSGWFRTEVSIDGGASWMELSEPAYTGTWSSGNVYWQIPDVETDECLVRITDCEYPAFAIVSPMFSVGPLLVGEIAIAAPGAGEVVVAGLSYWIQYEPLWERSTDGDWNRSLILEYSLDGGQTWIGDTSELWYATSVYCLWRIPDVESDQCYIRLSSVLYPGVTGVSGPIIIQRTCPCEANFALIETLPRLGENLPSYLSRTPLLRLSLTRRSYVRLSADGCGAEIEDYQAYHEPGEYILDPIVSFGIGFAYPAPNYDCLPSRVIRLNATCYEGTPACRARVVGDLSRPGGHVVIRSAWLPPENWNWAAIHSSACESGGAVLQSAIDLELVPMQHPDTWHADALRYYWGPYTEDADRIQEGSVGLPLSWRAGSFAADSEGDWLFEVWAELEGSRIEGKNARFRLTRQVPEYVIAGEVGSTTHLRGGYSTGPEVTIDFTPSEDFATSGVEALRYYWGDHPDDDDLMVSMGTALPLDWRSGSFAATEEGYWVFVLWGEDSAGNRSTDWMLFDFILGTPPLAVVGDVDSPTHERSEFSTDPDVTIEFTPSEDFATSGVEALRYYWGDHPDDDDLMVSMGTALPLDWRSGSFAATEEGYWVFVLWGEDSSGNRSTDWMLFDFMLGTPPLAVVGDVDSPTHERSEYSTDPDVTIEFTPSEDFATSGVEALRYYWGDDPDDDDLMVSMGTALPLDWRSDSFAATEEGYWMFVLWAVDSEGYRVSDFMAYDVVYHPSTYDCRQVSCDIFEVYVERQSPRELPIGMRKSDLEDILVTLSHDADVEISSNEPGKHSIMYSGWLEAGTHSVVELTGWTPADEGDDTILGPPRIGYIEVVAADACGCLKQHRDEYEIVE